jgi:hypothetical protein
MFSLASRLRSVAKSATVAAGVILFAAVPVVAQTTAPATAANAPLPTLEPMLERVT